MSLEIWLGLAWPPLDAPPHGALGASPLDVSLSAFAWPTYVLCVLVVSVFEFRSHKWGRSACTNERMLCGDGNDKILSSARSAPSQAGTTNSRPGQRVRGFFGRHLHAPHGIHAPAGRSSARCSPGAALTRLGCLAPFACGTAAAPSQLAQLTASAFPAAIHTADTLYGLPRREGRHGSVRRAPPAHQV